MADTGANTIVENYKGILQEYCQVRNLGDPSYEVTQYGSQNEPSWYVTIKYGQSSYTIPEPLRGSKRLAEQMAAKQVLEILELRQEAFLAGKSLDQEAAPMRSTPDVIASAGSESDPLSLQAETSHLTPIKAPIELITSALSVANHRLTAAAHSGARFRESSNAKNSDQVFAQNLADLTMSIVREVVNAAETANVKFAPSEAEFNWERHE